MKRSLLVGINDYPTAPLLGCINDAQKMEEVLARNEDGSPNFTCKLLTSDLGVVTRSVLRAQIEELFSQRADFALFYFSGHGFYDSTLGGYMVTQDAGGYDEGVPMSELVTYANNSSVSVVVLILDCCLSGALGNRQKNTVNDLREGVSILVASRDTQASVEVNGGGLFTGLLYEALRGGAADVIGKVHLASIYAYIDEALDAWMQRPLLKAHISRSQTLINCHSLIDLATLRELPIYFAKEDSEYPLDPSYEPESNKPLKEHTEIFRKLQKCFAVRLVEPIGETYMYFAAMNSKSCRLTALGKHYWHLAKKRGI
jgi:hypothetical protein